MSTSSDRSAQDTEGELRVLALVDRIFGLEAQLAQVSVFMNPDRERFEAIERELAGVQQQLAAVHGTATWRAGRFVLAPARWVKRGLRR